jgi:hypothetical protein
VDIPQLESDSNEFQRNKADPKSSCNAFPSRVIDGLLWIWPESGFDAPLEVALKEPNLCKTADNVEEDRLFVGKWNFRELPYGADYFLRMLWIRRTCQSGESQAYHCSLTYWNQWRHGAMTHFIFSIPAHHVAATTTLLTLDTMIRESRCTLKWP